MVHILIIPAAIKHLYRSATPHYIKTLSRSSKGLRNILHIKSTTKQCQQGTLTRKKCTMLSKEFFSMYRLTQKKYSDFLFGMATEWMNLPMDRIWPESCRYVMFSIYGRYSLVNGENPINKIKPLWKNILKEAIISWLDKTNNAIREYRFREHWMLIL